MERDEKGGRVCQLGGRACESLGFKGGDAGFGGDAFEPDDAEAAGVQDVFRAGGAELVDLAAGETEEDGEVVVRGRVVASARVVAGVIAGLEIEGAGARPAAAIGPFGRNGVGNPERRGRAGEGVERGLQRAAEGLARDLGVLEDGLGAWGLREGAGAGGG